MITVVLIEDNPVVRLTIEEKLKSVGYNVVALEDWSSIRTWASAWQSADVLVCDGDLINWDNRTAADVVALFRDLSRVLRVLYSTDIDRFQKEFPERVRKENYAGLFAAINDLAKT